MQRVIAVSWLGLACALACGPSEPRARAARDAFGLALERGDRVAALAAVEDLRAALPDTANALRELAAALVRAGSASDAIWLLESGVRRFPERDDLRIALAHVALLLANPTLAREAAGGVAPESEHHPYALLARAQAELELGDLEEALRVLARAEELYPDRFEARLARIGTLMKERRHTDARAAAEAFQRDLERGVEPDRELARRLAIALAQLRAHQGEPAEAIASLDAWLTEYPVDVAVWQALVQVSLQQNESRRALERVERALAGEDAPPELHAAAARIHVALGDDASAERSLRAYIEKVGSPAAYVPLVVHYSERDDAASAVALLDEAVEHYPEEASLHLLRAESLLAAARAGDARGAVERYLATTFEGDPQSEYLLARLDLAEGRVEQAAARLAVVMPRLDRASTQFW
ncbi:MAG: tetratricopeptide repeat protein, partial [Myxococcota bacterium]